MEQWHPYDYADQEKEEELLEKASNALSLQKNFTVEKTSHEPKVKGLL